MGNESRALADVFHSLDSGLQFGTKLARATAALLEVGGAGNAEDEGHLVARAKARMFVRRVLAM